MADKLSKQSDCSATVKGIPPSVLQPISGVHNDVLHYYALLAELVSMFFSLRLVFHEWRYEQT